MLQKSILSIPKRGHQQPLEEQAPWPPRSYGNYLGLNFVSDLTQVNKQGTLPPAIFLAVNDHSNICFGDFFHETNRV